MFRRDGIHILHQWKPFSWTLSIIPISRNYFPLEVQVSFYPRSRCSNFEPRIFFRTTKLFFLVAFKRWQYIYLPFFSDAWDLFPLLPIQTCTIVIHKATFLCVCVCWWNGVAKLNRTLSILIRLMGRSLVFFFFLMHPRCIALNTMQWRKPATRESLLHLTSTINSRLKLKSSYNWLNAMIR